MEVEDVELGVGGGEVNAGSMGDAAEGEGGAFAQAMVDSEDAERLEVEGESEVREEKHTKCSHNKSDRRFCRADLRTSRRPKHSQGGVAETEDRRTSQLPVPRSELSRFKKGSTQLPATKEEIDSGTHRVAALKEWLVNIVGNKVLGRKVKKAEVRAVVGMGWRCTWKERDDGSRKPKCRFFAKGFLDGRSVDTYVGTPSVAGINCVALFIVSQEMEMGAADVTAAFLTSKDHNQERVGATLPKVLPEYPKESPFPDVPQERYEELVKEARKFEAGETYLIEMGLYGLPCAAQLFDAKLEGVCKKLGFRCVDTAIAVRGKKGEPATAVIMNWIDDLLTGASKEEHGKLQATLNKELGFGSVCVIGQGSERKFSGVDIERVGPREVILSQASYLENTDTAPLWEILKERRPQKPWRGLDGKSAEPSKDEEVDEAYEKPLPSSILALCPPFQSPCLSYKF
uniref:Reverse transcriptase Ty1/copia-type domain-containing protein n=1 Tax=Chromera velia CCMP2878 TaxID=1169474 RepID=A0A0G4F0Q4_9ALVE|eukprot:Cvel_2594.t1-p1 / transcript=Cvel_2594.t1 / gene=Cvel_2594 / organism=Chromera_velia_CCMP2878 / gene_product=hypothetical protein / transcript_product=hypothetical protein / location=Cvel_scaffold102:115987-120115(+) / protein_length=457 / sequence_SO=supercontig / SO=protein_coding / is_pseudo=false